MKNCLTKLLNVTFYRVLKCMAVVCVLLSFSTNASAKGEWTAVFKAQAKIANASTADGKVFVSSTETSSPTWETNKDNTVEATATSGYTNSAKEQTFYWYAQVSDNSAFAGWYTDENATSSPVSTELNYKESLKSSSSGDTDVTKKYFALFKKMIDPVQSVIDWTKTDEEETYSTTVNLYKADNFKIQSTEHIGGANRTFSSTITSSTAENATLKLTAGADVADGDQFRITMVADNGGYATIIVNIKSRITVTFVHPSLGKGSYKAVQTNAAGTESCNISNTDADKEMSFTKTSQFYHTFTATPHSDYNLYRWVITHHDASVSYSTENPKSYTLQDGDRITAEFLPKNMAQFMVKGVDGIFYHKLEDAISAAQNSSSKTVVVYSSGILYNEHITPSIDGKYEFNIPSGITLLVPGDAEYTSVKELSTNHITSSKTRTKYRYLVLTNNTRLNVDGHICLYSPISHAANGSPTSYGEIEMKSNTEIILNASSQLTVFGYITGDPSDSHIIAREGSTVYETFQFTDWRGGTIMMQIVGRTRVFPMGQFFVQNIETKLTLEHGAKEYVSTAMYAMSGFVQAAPNVLFISNNTGSDSDNGFICLGPRTKISKWYDGNEDRQYYELNGDGSDSESKLGIVHIEASGMTVDSKAYVLPISSNMNVTFNNVNLTSLYDLSLLADAVVHIKENANMKIYGNVFLFDKEHNTGYFGSSSKKLMPINYTAYHDGAPSVRTDEINPADELDPTKVDDAKLIVDGKLQILESDNDNIQDGTGFYTTALGGDGISDNDEDYGANITSDKSGQVYFGVVGGKSVVKQLFQRGNEEWREIEIPITNARLRNGDRSWSAGENVAKNQLYTYSQSKKKWVLPQDVSFSSWDGHEFEVRMPEPTTINQDVVILMNTEDELSLENFDINLPGNSFFTMGDPNYNKVNKQLIIPITYHVKNIHNLNSPNTEDLTIKCIDTNLDRELDSYVIKLTATEDYTPDFTIAIGDKDVTTDKQYTFAQTSVLNSLSANVKITPMAGTVATLSNTTWEGVAATSPTFTTTGSAPSSLEVVYTPQSAVDHTGTLSVSAIYTDAAHRTISKNILVNLNGTGRLQDNTLAFKQELINGYTIDQGLTYQNAFASLGNGNNVTFTCTYVGGDVDGQDASALVTVSSADGNYTIKANEVTSITDARQVKVTASQSSTSIMNSTSREIVLTVVPPAIWNWSDLYFGQSYTNPVTPSRNDQWNLVEVNDPSNMVGDLQGDYTNYSTTIATGDPNTVYEATFKFVQGQNEKEFTSKIYADPRALGFCVDASHKYKGVTKSATGGVSFDDNNAQISFKAGAEWVIQMSGTPDKMTFETNGENLWNIEQRASESSAWIPVVTWANLGSGDHSFSLLPTTSYVRISYGAANTQSVGQISEFCISKLNVKSDIDELYLSIHKDGTTSSKTIVLTHTEATIPTLSPIPGLTFSTEISNNLGTSEEPYYQTTVTITAASTFAKGDYTLTATQGATSAYVSVHADYFPQGLPIKLAIDDVQRYHFVAVASEHVSWDAASKQVVLQNPGGSVARSVVLTFEGAPSRISFTASRDIIDSEWRIYESVDGTDGSFVESSLANRDKEAGAKLTHNLKYTTRYVRIYYYSDNQNELRLSDLLIEGDPMLLVNPEELEFDTDDRNKSLTLTAINLNNIRIELDNVSDFRMSHGTADACATYLLSSEDYREALGVNKVGDIVINTEWITNSLVNDGIITIYNVDDNDAILAKVKLVGAGKYLHKDDAKTTGLYTGIPDGSIDPDKNYTYHGSFTDYEYHQVDLSSAFAEDGTALFDYLIVYGETTTTDASKIITAPSGEKGSNARTPYNVYVRDVDAYGNYDRYRHAAFVDNANQGSKVHIPGVTMQEDGKTIFMGVDAGQKMSVYMTGFCPYATTGFTSDQEGAWFFRGRHGAKLDVYLENCCIYSRNKMEDGQPFYARGDERNPVFTEDYARGSGGVLVFECVDETSDLVLAQPFDVTIHTKGKNMLKSNYGCFCYFFGMDPFQISAPIHVRMHSAEHISKSKTSLTFDDKWPMTMNSTTGEIINTSRTNGFLSLQKLNNNAPSIDIGSPNTVVNFMGGQVELQNAQIVSTNYKTTLAISYRSGEYGADNVGIKFATGIGTDAVGGEVNFYDGTITVIPMWVSEEYKQYYLIDRDDSGNEIVRDVTKNGKTVTEYRTTCLRCPKNTEIFGGSVCWLRACQHVTSKGGAPTFAGKHLGQYIYDLDEMGGSVDEKKLASGISFPDGITDANGYKLSEFYKNNAYHPNHEYGLESVSPDSDAKLYFWIPEGFGGVSAEKDKLISTWKACMTEIGADYKPESGSKGQSGAVGGDMPVESNEEIKYMLYCKIDENIHNVISAGTGDLDDRVYTYEAPVKVPNVAQGYVGGEYMTIKPTLVGDQYEHEVLSDVPYNITDKVFYITTATADVWQTFTAPFDVEKIWVVETYDENSLKKSDVKYDDDDNPLSKRQSIMLEQAKHNADFAAFFGVAMAIGSTDPFQTIFDDWKKWGKLQDQRTEDSDGNPIPPLYSGVGTYTLRDKYELIPFIGNNWDKANFYLNHNKGNWELYYDEKTEEDVFNVQWEVLDQTDLDDGVLLHQGETYSMLFPYCTGCWEIDEDENVLEREFWDYWSGKFLIFESTLGTTDKPHKIQGSNYVAATKTEDQEWVFDDAPENVQDAIVTGNSTFAFMNTSRENIYEYVPNQAAEAFFPIFLEDEGESIGIKPTVSFLYADILENIEGMPAKKVTRDGKIIYGQVGGAGSNPQGPTTGQGHIPTVGGGNQLFITAIDGGINIAVAEPQHVRVVSATGVMLFNDYVTDNVDVQLPVNGIYVVQGEEEAQKIFY